MKTEIRNKILKLGIVKPCQANFLIKYLSGDQSIESGEDIVVDSRRNNGCKLKFEEFWQVKVILRYF